MILIAAIPVIDRIRLVAEARAGILFRISGLLAQSLGFSSLRFEFGVSTASEFEV